MFHSQAAQVRTEKDKVEKKGKDQTGTRRVYESPRLVFVGRTLDLVQGSGTAALDFGGYGWMRRY